MSDKSLAWAYKVPSHLEDPFAERAGIGWKKINASVAKACDKDFDDIGLMFQILAATLEDAAYPPDTEGIWPDDQTPWDFNSPEDALVLVDRLQRIFDRSPSAWRRVFWGAKCLFDPENHLIDPGAATLKKYPGLTVLSNEDQTLLRYARLRASMEESEVVTP